MKPRRSELATITDRKQLWDLPVDTVVKDANGQWFQLVGKRPQEPWNSEWSTFYSEYTFTQKDIALPIQVIEA